MTLYKKDNLLRATEKDLVRTLHASDVGSQRTGRNGLLPIKAVKMLLRIKQESEFRR